MKKQFFGILLSLCMALTLLPVAAFAEGSDEPADAIALASDTSGVTTVTADNFSACVNEEVTPAGKTVAYFKSGNYKLGGDIDVSSQYANVLAGYPTSARNVSLDLNGHKLTVSKLTIESNSTLTLTDSSGQNGELIVIIPEGSTLGGAIFGTPAARRPVQAKQFAKPAASHMVK